MLNVFICEDNKTEREHVEEAVLSTINAENINFKLTLSSENPYEILEYVKENNCCGLYFLDVDLKCDINGIALAEQIRKYDPRGFIVFVTTHAEMSYLTFQYKVEAMDYIIKDQFFNIGSRIRECMMNANKKFTIKSSKIEQSFTFKAGDKVIGINLDEILYFETSKTVHKVILHCKNRQIEFYSKMNDIEKQLDSRFFRCHRSYLVNKNNILKLDKDSKTVYLKHDEQCLVSSRLLKGLVNSIDPCICC